MSHSLRVKLAATAVGWTTLGAGAVILKLWGEAKAWRAHAETYELLMVELERFSGYDIQIQGYTMVLTSPDGTRRVVFSAAQPELNYGLVEVRRMTADPNVVRRYLDGD